MNAPPADVVIRIHLVNLLAELLMAEEIDPSDIIEFLDDWMEENFAVIPDENSHREIAETLIRVRQELTFCAVNDIEIKSGSLTLQKLHEINERNKPVVSQMNAAAQA